jgi:hypothetical protein
MNKINKPENPYYSNTDTTKLHLTDAEWKKGTKETYMGNTQMPILKDLYR